MSFGKNGKPIALLFGQNWLFSGTFQALFDSLLQLKKVDSLLQLKKVGNR